MCYQWLQWDVDPRYFFGLSHLPYMVTWSDLYHEIDEYTQRSVNAASL